MPNLIINQNQFCPNGQFLDLVVDILCNPKGIFDVLAKNPIKDIYDDMRQKINCNQYCIYPLPGSSVQNGINNSLLISNGRYYAGHDLPVWLNNPSQADYRLLVVSQDPRRNADEMNNKEVGISTPFGLHSMEWRSKKSKGLIHWVVAKLFEDFGKLLSVYYTDVYKFRGVDDKSNKIKSTIDTNNFQIYKEIFKKEIDAFNPTIVLLMGDKAEEAYYSVCPPSPKDVRIPHQAPTANRKWGKVLKKEPTSDKKIEYIYNLLYSYIMNKDTNQLYSLLKKKIQSKDELNEWYRSLAKQYANLIVEEDPNISEDDLIELAKKRARSHIEERNLIVGKNAQQSIMLYGVNESQRLEYIKDALDILKTNDNIDVRLISIDLSKLDNKQLNELNSYSEYNQEQFYLLFLDNLDKASFEVYESVRLILKNQRRPFNIRYIAGLSKKKSATDYVDDGLVTSCLCIEI